MELSGKGDRQKGQGQNPRAVNFDVSQMET